MCFTSLRVTWERSRNAKLECAFCRFGNAGSHFCDKATSSAGGSRPAHSVRFAVADHAKPRIDARLAACGSDGAAAGNGRCSGDDRGYAGDDLGCAGDDRYAQCVLRARRADRRRRDR